jgi:hypothetical protein
LLQALLIDLVAALQISQGRERGLDFTEQVI